MPHILLEIKAKRFTTREPEDLDEMMYAEQIKGAIEQALKGHNFYKYEVRVWGEKDA
jgi:hypothetical protein